jgi:hypothetical protein
MASGVDVGASVARETAVASSGWLRVGEGVESSAEGPASRAAEAKLLLNTLTGTIYVALSMALYFLGSLYRFQVNVNHVGWRKFKWNR